MKKQMRMAILMLVDIVLINFSFLGAFLLRFDGKIETQYLDLYVHHIVIIVLVKLLIFYFFNLYKSVWRYAGIDELVRVVMAAVVSNALLQSYYFLLEVQQPRSIFLICMFLDMTFLGGIRLAYRLLNRWQDNQGLVKSNITPKNIMIIGAGDAGALVIKELRQHPELFSDPRVLVDDDDMKQGQILYHVRVEGTSDDVVELAEEYQIDEIIIAIPSATKDTIRRIVKKCEKTKATLKIVPGVYEMIEGEFNYGSIREVQIEDLLGRDEINLDIDPIKTYVEGKTVMITGGGGSIGSELARQICPFEPKRLVLLDIYENNLYDLQQELIRTYPDRKFEITCVIASVRDRENILNIVKKYKPNVIFHAAAHKHVPLMEDNPKEAIKNNVLGTYNVASAADAVGVARFVMISTDKAVNPTNVMGATKRICEMIIQSFAKHSKTEYVGVRFGNVLGSNGSVIPLFKRQIKEVGYVTVTHPDIIRYFMTIPEAAKLVIQAGSMAKGGELFVLDMGEPVKILDLAKDLIRLSGFEPDVDIPIRFMGLRPGEKLYEELLMDEEGIKETKHDKIFIGKPLNIDPETLQAYIKELREVAYSDCGKEVVLESIEKIVPTYHRKKD